MFFFQRENAILFVISPRLIKNHSFTIVLQPFFRINDAFLIFLPIIIPFPFDTRRKYIEYSRCDNYNSIRQGGVRKLRENSSKREVSILYGNFPPTFVEQLLKRSLRAILSGEDKQQPRAASSSSLEKSASGTSNLLEEKSNCGN